MKNTVFIDESGTLPDTKDRVIVVAAVGTTFPNAIVPIVNSVRKKRRLLKRTGELKFYTAGEKTKSLFFNRIVNEKFDVFVLTVEKLGRKIPDTPKHFAILCWLLLSEVYRFYSDIDKVVFDRHFHREKDVIEFNNLLKKYLGKAVEIEHVDSLKDKRVAVVDMVAGAVLSYQTGKEVKFYQIFKKIIISETKINWIEAKRRLLLTKKIA